MRFSAISKGSIVAGVIDPVWRLITEAVHRQGGYAAQKLATVKGVAEPMHCRFAEIRP
jgi:hypothetical protein